MYLVSKRQKHVRGDMSIFALHNKSIAKYLCGFIKQILLDMTHFQLKIVMALSFFL